LAVLAVVLLLAGGGCGTAAYERRMDETVRYFSYLDRLNQYLSPGVWRAPGVELRVPKQFQQIPPPAEGSDPKARDPRQPTFASIELPGLLGAWQANLARSGNAGNAKAFLYVLSNGDLLAQPNGAEKASAFNDSVARQIAVSVEQSAAVMDKMGVYEVPKGPPGDSYAAKRSFRLAPLLPASVDDQDYNIAIYGYQNEKSPAQVTIVFVFPENVSPNERMERAMDLALETVDVSDERPAPGQPSPSAAGAGGAPKKSAGF
jgi:hypothetical protein